MATGKRFYYLKLKKDFLFSETVGYMMSLPNGPAYVVLYEKQSPWFHAASLKTGCD